MTIGRFDTWQAVAGKYRAEVEELTAERDAALEQVKHWRAVTQDVDAWARADKRLYSAEIYVLKSALREAKETLSVIAQMDGSAYYIIRKDQVAKDAEAIAFGAIAAINKVLGEE